MFRLVEVDMKNAPPCPALPQRSETLIKLADFESKLHHCKPSSRDEIEHLPVWSEFTSEDGESSNTCTQFQEYVEFSRHSIDDDTYMDTKQRLSHDRGVIFGTWTSLAHLCGSFFVLLHELWEIELPAPPTPPDHRSCLKFIECTCVITEFLFHSTQLIRDQREWRLAYEISSELQHFILTNVEKVMDIWRTNLEVMANMKRVPHDEEDFASRLEITNHFADCLTGTLEQARALAFLYLNMVSEILVGDRCE